jgi:hypothetical protein
MSPGTVAREIVDNDDGDAGDGVLIDFKGARKQQLLREAMSSLQEMLVRLNARPGSGMNFALIFEIAVAERRVNKARYALGGIDRGSHE